MLRAGSQPDPQIESSDDRTRLIICVDGTWCSPDGKDPGGRGNITNVYRIYASTKQGPCYDKSTNTTINQVVRYVEGIGSADDAGSWDRTAAGAFGKGYKKLIREVYRQCCQLNEKDQVWLYGFSRGAYIVRAVAGLLHWIGALREANFDADYKRALDLLPNSVNRSRQGPGRIHNHYSANAKLPPRICFVGVFDTVKAVQDANLYDISYNDSIEHLRHALALNENRKAMLPEHVRPDYDKIKIDQPHRSLIEAWFVGAHIDIGGSAASDGLSLYPCQWMLIESRAKGLVLEFSRLYEKKAPLDNPLEVLFPASGITATESDDHEYRTCKTQNQIVTTLQDLQNTHNASRYNNRYNIRINKKKAAFWPKQLRAPFDTKGNLQGYTDSGPYGTIIHPSVYRFLDMFPALAIIKSEMPEYTNLERLREAMLGEASGDADLISWDTEEAKPNTSPPLRSLRVLVCGDAGVGKSTLINRMFGVFEDEQVTSTSHRQSGRHNINDEIVHAGREDLILHDSEGFEAGTQAQIQAVENFFKDRGSRHSSQECLHVIWLCIDMQSDRPLQVATKSLLEAKRKFVNDVPIIVVATRKDRLEDMKYMEARRRLARSITDRPTLESRCHAIMLQAVSERLQQIENEILEAGIEPDACVSVGQDDVDSINHLSTVTLQNMNNEKIRGLFVAAQIASIDIKVDLAIAKTMSVYRKILRTTLSLSALPLAATSSRLTAASIVCKEILTCFGIRDLDASEIQHILRTNVWDYRSAYTSIPFAEALAVAGIGLITTPFLLPATARLMLILAADLILILSIAFKKAAEDNVGQPHRQHIQASAGSYRDVSSEVHSRIMALVPRSSLTKTFRHGEIGVLFGRIVQRYKELVVNGPEQQSLATTESSLELDVVSDEASMSEMKEDFEVIVEAFKSMQT